MAADHDPWAHLDRHISGTNGADPLEKILYVDRKLYLCDDILVKVDRSCMLASLEVRCPFLDQEVVEFVAQLPTHLLLRAGRGKLLLRRAMADLLPRGILEREKRGFGLDLPRFLGRRLETLGREILLDPKSRVSEFLDAGYVRLLIRRHEEGKKDLSGQIWTLILLGLWCRNHLDGPGTVAHARA
jgi:asparagine synthase (glutamine-hydrolysing)